MHTPSMAARVRLLWQRARACDSALSRWAGRAGQPRARTTQASCAPPSPVFVTARTAHAAPRARQRAAIPPGA